MFTDVNETKIINLSELLTICKKKSFVSLSMKQECFFSVSCNGRMRVFFTCDSVTSVENALLDVVYLDEASIAESYDTYSIEFSCDKEEDYLELLSAARYYAKEIKEY